VETRESSTQRWRFGIFEVDIRNSELRRGGTPVKLREQSFRILLLLLERAGDIVTREELRQGLWPSDTYVDFDHGLNSAIMKLRDALGDSADKPLYIETIPKRGYRFVAPLSLVPALTQTADSRILPSSELSTTDNGPKAFVALAPVEQPRHLPSRWRRPAPAIGALALLLLAAVGSILYYARRHLPEADGGSPPRSALRIVPITTAPGDPIFPAFSPDGREITYAWDGPERKRYDLYVQLIGADAPLRLTQSQGGVLGPPAWSPDGREIAYSRCDGKNDGVYLVPALGGAERKLTAVGCLYTLPGPLAWLSGGKAMLMIDHCTGDGPFGVVLFSLATGEKRCLTTSGSPKGSDAGYGFALSPDGRTIAYSSTTVSLCCDIYTVPLAGGPPKHLTSDGQIGCSTVTEFGCSGLMWTPDGKSIVFISNRATLPTLWRVSANGGAVVHETEYPALGSFSKDGRSFVYSERTSAEPPSIWRADLAAPGGPVVKAHGLIKTQYPEMDAQPSPDGGKIVWMSIRTGFEELWMCDAAGENAQQLTHLDRYSGTPRWAPDGNWIVFDSYTTHGAQIFVIDPDGRNLREITSGPYDNAVPSWSRDGRSLYFASKRTGSWQLWKHSLAVGREVQMTQHGGFNAFESLDGQTLYFSKFDHGGIWKLPANGGPASGGEESLAVADKPQVGYWGHWAVSRYGLYLLNTEGEPGPSIEFHPFNGHLSRVLTLSQRPARLQPSLSASADGKTLYYTQYDRQSVIKLIEFAR
jgi:Tol biopolymer transport system component/DNA-binding winged helix-turn-helix (wHTH) protein